MCMADVLYLFKIDNLECELGQARKHPASKETEQTVSKLKQVSFPTMLFVDFASTAVIMMRKKAQKVLPICHKLSICQSMQYCEIKALKQRSEPAFTICYQLESLLFLLQILHDFC